MVIKALKPIANIGQHFRLKNAVLPLKFYSADGDEVENMNLFLEVVNGHTSFGMIGNGDNIVTPITKEAFNLKAYPVPFSAEISFDFLLPSEELVHLSLFDSFGRMISEKNEVLQKGPQILKMSDLAKYPTGFYWYSLKAGGQTFFGKIVKNQ